MESCLLGSLENLLGWVPGRSSEHCFRRVMFHISRYMLLCLLHTATLGEVCAGVKIKSLMLMIIR